MPRGGHNRKPTALKLVQNTHRADRVVEQEAVIQGDVDITPPPEFEGVELLVWQECTKVLTDARILTSADLLQLKNYCQQWAIIEAAAQEIRDHGVLIDNGSGSKVKNPALTAHKEASTAMRSLSATLGLDPGARARINVGKLETKQGGFADL